ncbi:MAG: DUF72 domain-containing protein [Planctomycetota bacterium]
MDKTSAGAAIADSAPPGTAACALYVGTSGYSYAEWTEAGFYPPGTKAAQMLPLYAREFRITELNYTWYQMPKADALERQRRQAPAGFRFAAKLTRTLTHEIEEGGWRLQAAQYRAGVTPLVQAGQLAAVLVQLPPDFGRTTANRQYLAALLQELRGLPLAAEFRHASWNEPRVFEELARRQVALAVVDEPALPGLFPALPVVTNPQFFYVRFHGRNARGWRSGQLQSKFDYDYTDAELRDWIVRRIEPMARQARQGFLFFNNHVRGQAPRNAKQLLRLLMDNS